MSQSPIRLQAVDSKTFEVDALPLLQPFRLFECLYKPGNIKGCFEGECGHANFVIKGPGPHVRFRGVSYELKKIHIHSKSEHIVEQDDHHDFEVHLVHAPLGSPVASPLVVIGILFKVSGKVDKSSKLSATISEFVKSLESQICIEFDPLVLFPGKKGKPDLVEWFHYEGSLTGYPYSENVSWIVMRNTALILKSDIEEIRKHAEQEPRGLQPLDRRLVVRSFLDKTEGK